MICVFFLISQIDLDIFRQKSDFASLISIIWMIKVASSLPRLRTWTVYFITLRKTSQSSTYLKTDYLLETIVQALNVGHEIFSDFICIPVLGSN